MPTDPLMLALARAAAACYADDVVYAWENATKTAHLVHTAVNRIETFAFTGTLPKLDEWMVDFLALPVPVAGHPQMGDLHAGFLIDAQGAVSEFIAPTLAALGWPPFYLTGHSKGGGEAPAATGELKALGHPPLAVRLYEPPMCGGADLAAYLADQDIVWTQTWNAAGADRITEAPIGPTWRHNGLMVPLRVPDGDSLATKHRMPAVLAALAA